MFEWFASNAGVETTEEYRSVVGTRSDVILAEHVTTVDVQLAAFHCVFVHQLPTFNILQRLELHYKASLAPTVVGGRCPFPPKICA